MSRQLLVFGEKTFKITIPDDAKVTFGPWSPGTKDNYGGEKSLRGTLRIYEGKTEKSTILGVFSGVTSFRDLSALDYIEQVAREEGAIIWKDDENGYSREENVSQTHEWTTTPPLPSPNGE
jgi:hypothetical protein|tara:strand:+ start:2321 stop:2683 length:363 start_codon:yes stop_codon:yes gene_type:complete